ncbi:hypothetical protein CLAIMM_00567 [Cladophialophora immunda]|nr:hypothetical protein CLAIMM_00567 [Cladophialophora immunda]
MFQLPDHAAQARTAFKQLVERSSFQALDVVLRQDLRDAQQNFMLWAVNLGVFDHGHASLEYRLQDVPEAMELVKDLLTDLSEQLQAIQQLIDHSDPSNLTASPSLLPNAITTEHVFVEAIGEQDTDSEEEEDLPEALARTLSLTDIVHRLFRLARTLRNHSTRSAQGRRNIYSTFPSEGRKEIVARLIDIELLRVADVFIHLRKQDFDGFVDSEEEIALSVDDLCLIQRLARANSRRRQQFAYWRARHERSMRAALLAEQEQEPQQALSQAEESRKPAQVQEAELEAIVDANRNLRPESIPSSVTRVRRDQIDLSERKSVASDISRSPSVRGPAGEKAMWPSMPEGLPKRPYFECPFCFNLCPDRCQSGAGWKAHLIHDLKPYCCTYPICDTGDQLYDSWADWTTHEMLVHNKVWTCLEHPEEEYATLEGFRNHVHLSHTDEAESMLTPEIIAARATGSNVSGRTCPFCLGEVPDSGKLQHHIAWHLESMALISLPRSTGYEEGSDEGDLRSDVQRANGVDSRMGELDDISLPGEETAATQTVDQGVDQGTLPGTEDIEELESITSREGINLSLERRPRFRDSEVLSTACRKMLRNVADYMIEEWEPKQSIVIDTYKMQRFYQDFLVPGDIYPWNMVMDYRTSSISRLWRTFDIEHHYVPTLDLTARPDLPALTHRGFTDWMDLTYQVQPEIEAKRLLKIREDILKRSLSTFLHASKEMRLQADGPIQVILPANSITDQEALLKEFREAVATHCNVNFNRVDQLPSKR